MLSVTGMVGAVVSTELEAEMVLVGAGSRGVSAVDLGTVCCAGCGFSPVGDGRVASFVVLGVAVGGGEV